MEETEANNKNNVSFQYKTLTNLLDSPKKGRYEMINSKEDVKK